MSRNFPLELTSTPQVLPISGGELGFHKIFIVLGSAPSSGFVSVEKRQIGSNYWQPIEGGENVDVSTGEVAIYTDGAVGALRVSFIALSGGSAPSLWLSSEPTAQPPLRLLTDNGIGQNARVRVDSGQTGFFARRMWEFLYEFTTLADVPVTFRFIIPCNFIVHHSTLSVDQGGVTWRTYSGAQGSADGAFATEVPYASVNTMTEADEYDFLSSIATGGTFTPTASPPANPITALRVRTAGATAQQSSVGGGAIQEKGRAGGFYYGTLARMSGVSGDCKGTLIIVVEERPQ